ncbi:hypothetical protein K8R14_00340 [bacterium]|nr:hypothetical protein [bacterium]
MYKFKMGDIVIEADSVKGLSKLLAKEDFSHCSGTLGAIILSDDTDLACAVFEHPDLPHVIDEFVELLKSYDSITGVEVLLEDFSIQILFNLN